MLLKISLGTVIIAVISLLLVYFRMFLYRKEIKEVRKENPNKKINKTIDGVMRIILWIIIPILNIILILGAIVNLIISSAKFIANMTQNQHIGYNKNTHLSIILLK